MRQPAASAGGAMLFLGKGNGMHRQQHSRFFMGDIITNAMLMVVAVAIAFSLPGMVNAFIYRWWPVISTNPDMLFLAEAGFAALLVFVFFAIKNALQNREVVGSARLAALVHASSKNGWLTRWRERLLIRKIPAVECACVMTVTGYDTFAQEDSQFHQVLDEAREIRVMLLNPLSDGARLRADSLSEERDYYGRMLEEIYESIGYLKSLRSAGKKVTLKFYDHRPFWKLVIIGDYVWVQYCQDGFEINAVPEYVFALQSNSPERGLYTPFNTLFAEKWNEMPTQEFDFETDELVQRDASGAVLGRALLPHSPHAEKKLAIARHSQCALTGYIPNEA
jgi:hypothetical protein